MEAAPLAACWKGKSASFYMPIKGHLSRIKPRTSQLPGSTSAPCSLPPCCLQAAIDAVQEAKVASASDGSPSEKRRASNHEPPQPQQKVEPHVHSPKAVVVLGHGGHMGGIAASLQMFCGPGNKQACVVCARVPNTAPGWHRHFSPAVLWPR